MTEQEAADRKAIAEALIRMMSKTKLRAFRREVLAAPVPASAAEAKRTVLAMVDNRLQELGA